MIFLLRKARLQLLCLTFCKILFCKVRKNKTQWVYSHHLSSLHCSKSVRNWMFKKFFEKCHLAFFCVFTLIPVNFFRPFLCFCCCYFTKAWNWKPPTGVTTCHWWYSRVVWPTEITTNGVEEKVFNPFIDSHNSNIFWLFY